MKEASGKASGAEREASAKALRWKVTANLRAGTEKDKTGDQFGKSREK